MKSTTKGLLSLIFQGGIATLLFTALIVGTNIAYFYEPEINTVLAPPIVDKTSLKQTTVEGQKMSARIMEEGSVLLQNKDNILPLSMEENPKVNVFGWHSIDWIYGTGGDQVGSGGVLPEDDDFDKNIDLYRALNNYNISYNKDLYDMYYRYFKPFNLGRSLKNGSINDAQKLVEPDIDDKNYYSDALLNEAKAYSDTRLSWSFQDYAEKAVATPLISLKTALLARAKMNHVITLRFLMKKKSFLPTLAKTLRRSLF